MAKNEYTKLAKNTLIFAAGNILTKLVYFLMVPLYTSALSTAQYGVAEMLNTLIEILYPIVTVCIVDALYRFTIDDDSDFEQVFGISTRIVLESVGVVLVFSGVAFAVTRDVNCILFFFLYASYCIYKLFLQFARGLGYNVRFSIAGVLNALVLTGMNVFLLLGLHGGVRSYILSIIVANVVAAVYIFFAAKEYQHLPRRFTPDRQLRRSMLRYALPNIPNMLSWWIVNVSDRYLLLFLVSDAACGTYTAASKLPSLISTFSMIFQQAWQYSATKERKSENHDQFCSDIFKIYSAFLVCFTAVVVLCTIPLSRLILHNEFYEGRFVLPVLMVASVFGCYSGYFGTFYGVVKKNMMAMVSTVASAVCNIALNLLLIPIIGGLGAAYATLVSYALIVIIRAVDTRKYVKLKVPVGKILLENALLILEAVVMTLTFPLKYPIAVALALMLLLMNLNTILLILRKCMDALAAFRKRKTI